MQCWHSMSTTDVVSCAGLTWNFERGSRDQDFLRPCVPSCSHPQAAQPSWFMDAKHRLRCKTLTTLCRESEWGGSGVRFAHPDQCFKGGTSRLRQPTLQQKGNDSTRCSIHGRAIRGILKSRVIALTFIWAAMAALSPSAGSPLQSRGSDFPSALSMIALKRLLQNFEQEVESSLSPAELSPLSSK